MVAGVGVMVSVVWMAVLWGDGSDPSRGYFGTDTRVHSLLVGVLLGVILVGRPVTGGRAGRLAAIAAMAGTLGLVGAIAVSHEDSAFLQHGGFLLVAVATAAMIAGLERARPLQRMLSARPLVALGVISYGVYLWHWPVIVVLDEVRTGFDGAALVALRLTVTLGIAALSFVLVERPIRAAGSTAATRRPAFAIASIAMIAVAALVMGATTVPVSTASLPPWTPSSVPPNLAGATDLPIGVVMVGDSVARSLAGGLPGWKPWRPELSPFDPGLVDLWSLAIDTCSYLDGHLIYPDGRRQHDNEMLCGGLRRDLRDVLSRGDHSIVLVNLLNDAGDRLIEGQTVELGSDDHLQSLAAFLDELSEFTSEYGAEVVVLSLPPRSGDAMTSADLPDGRRDRLLRDELLSYATTNPQVSVLDAFDEMCPSGDCSDPSSTFDPDWRPDGLHFSPEGAREIADWITLQLLAPDDQPSTTEAST